METRAHTAELPLRPQDEVECRRCNVHCDKVVYPAACVAKSCPFLYAIEEFGHRYIGCMQTVFDVEIDVNLLAAAERTRERLRRGEGDAPAPADVHDDRRPVLREPP